MLTWHGLAVSSCRTLLNDINDMMGVMDSKQTCFSSNHAAMLAKLFDTLLLWRHTAVTIFTDN